MHNRLDYSAMQCYIFNMNRYLNKHIINDLKKKMVFITGPRQVGKTYLAKAIAEKFSSSVYLNYDDIDHARMIRKRQWPTASPLIIFDELHKMKNWKNYLKGTFDTRPANQQYLITGSARLDTFRQTGDSLAGRYYHYRLNPFSVRELKSPNETPYDILSRLITLGGFPEPYLSGTPVEANRWRQQYFTGIVREDILDFSRIQEVRAIRLLVDMLRKRVGAPLSFSSLARDLQIAPNTVKKYIAILESLYIVFLIRPYHRDVARAILKEPKIYFYDCGYVNRDEGSRFENAVAVSLLKHAQYLQDVEAQNISLHYIRTKEGRELDFVLTLDGQARQGIEVKLSDDHIAPPLAYFKKKLPEMEMLQLVHNLRQEKDVDGISVRHAGEWLANLAA